MGAYISIAFKDTGMGIDKEILKRVAEPFFTTKEPKQGFGFGLSNTQVIIKGHKGFMVLESTQSSGTKLTLYIPAELRQADMVEEVATSEEHSLGQGRLVLVADDELFIRKTIKRTLEDRATACSPHRTGPKPWQCMPVTKKRLILWSPMWRCPSWMGRHSAARLRSLILRCGFLFQAGTSRKKKCRRLKPAASISSSPSLIRLINLLTE